MTIKSIIDGRRYNSDTSTKIAEYSWGYRSDFHYYSEELYRTPKGAWWMYGDGGAASKYSRADEGGGSSGGERVFTLTATEVREWLEQHDRCDALESHFGDVLEDA